MRQAAHQADAGVQVRGDAVMTIVLVSTVVNGVGPVPTVTSSVPSSRWPSPLPDGSQLVFEKNSRRYVPGWLSSVP